jgi:hypothetical protein
VPPGVMHGGPGGDYRAMMGRMSKEMVPGAGAGVPMGPYGAGGGGGAFGAVQKQLAAVLQRLSNVESALCKDSLPSAAV